METNLPITFKKMAKLTEEFVGGVYLGLLRFDATYTPGDVVYLIQQWMRRERERANPTGSFTDCYPAYSDIVLALYALAMSEGIEYGEMKSICRALERCSNHEFNPFVRLTNRRHNPNKQTRDWAFCQLVSIAIGNKHQHSIKVLNWQEGAKYRIRQMQRAGTCELYSPPLE